MNEWIDVGQHLPSTAEAYERHRDSEYVEHLQALAEREVEAGEHRTDWKPDKRVSRREAWGEGKPQLFRRLVLDRDQGCCVHTNPADCDEGWQAHHVVPQQVLRRMGAVATLWNPLSGMGVCGLIHRRHHSGHALIPYELIPTVVVGHLSSLGFGPYLERHYAAIGATLRDGQA